MGMMTEFRKFVLRGNVMDMAVGFTVGAGFTALVKSLVDNIIMPPIGLLLGDVDFKDKYVVLREGATPVPEGATLTQAKELGAVTLDYGIFINNLITLLIVALVVFLLIRLLNKVEQRMETQFGGKPADPGEPSDKKCPYCLSTIPYRAAKCAHCTSELEPSTSK